MKKNDSYENIFTPQGILGKVSKNPNLDFLMNIFNIPRIYSVSGFGEWNVGQHSVATAFISLFWSKFNNYTDNKRDRLVTLALVHDIHEAVTGDILPFFKTPEVRTSIDTIQKNILKAFSIEEENLKKELKLIDKISFLYEISKSSPKGLKSTRTLLAQIFEQQQEEIFIYATEHGFKKQNIKKFLALLEL